MNYRLALSKSFRLHYLGHIISPGITMFPSPKVRTCAQKIINRKKCVSFQFSKLK